MDIYKSKICCFKSVGVWIQLPALKTFTANPSALRNCDGPSHTVLSEIS